MRGTRLSRLHGVSGRRDHPRVCGEHAGYNSADDTLEGSSPRMRGTPSLPRQADGRVGIIPAYAGNTSGVGPLPSFFRDHPRVCGEHDAIVVPLRFRAGSSPRMRGTPFCQNWLRLGYGIIPAYAGNTCIHQRQPFSSRDHPRVCGEHVANTSRGIFRSGSSPRMRGTPQGHGTLHGRAGIIPAYAGNTLDAGFSCFSNGDHPRVCGEHAAANFRRRSV